MTTRQVTILQYSGSLALAMLIEAGGNRSLRTAQTGHTTHATKPLALVVLIEARE